MRTSVNGCRRPRFFVQPSFFLRKLITFLCLPWETTSPSTAAPATTGRPTLASPSPPTSSTSNVSFPPTSASTFSTLRRSPSVTRYCLPPVLITAYIGCSLDFLGSFAYLATNRADARPSKPSGRAVLYDRRAGAVKDSRALIAGGGRVPSRVHGTQTTTARRLPRRPPPRFRPFRGERQRPDRRAGRPAAGGGAARSARGPGLG